MNMKYIVIERTELFIFPSHVDHKEFADRVSGSSPVTSAGFVENSPTGLICRGESHALGIGSSPVDTALMRISLGV